MKRSKKEKRLQCSQDMGLFLGTINQDGVDRTGAPPLQLSQSEGVRRGRCGMTARSSAGQWDNGGAPSSPRAPETTPHTKVYKSDRNSQNSSRHMSTAQHLTANKNLRPPCESSDVDTVA
ncbi:unnamed protein product [Leuciscus chuanchicus]